MFKKSSINKLKAKLQEKPANANPMRRALSTVAGSSTVAVAFDPRPRVTRNRKVYTRKGRGRITAFAD